MPKLNIIAFILYVLIGSASVYGTPLDDYVNTPDPHYKYELIHTYEMYAGKVYILNMTSQKWQDETFIKSPIWWHTTVVSIPDKITRPGSAFMLIDGGKNEDGVIPKLTDEAVTIPSLFSLTTGAVAAILRQTPNQPVYFLKDPAQKRRVEDSIIAWTWKTFLENISDPTVLLRMPMTKAAVRGMDTITDFVKKTASVNIDKYMIAGASKRGWTTWTTAAVDKRVFAAIPMVMDILNINQNLHTNFRALGGWTFAFQDYYVENITTKVDTYEMFAMQRIVDPATYLDRYRNVKFLVVNTGGDEFFLPDNTYTFWRDLVAATAGTCLMRRLPNAEHKMAGHQLSLFFTYRSFFLTNYENKPLPKVTWSRNNNFTHGILEAVVDISTGLMPLNETVYFAQTLDNKRRDFRLFIKNPNDPSKPLPHPVIWVSDPRLLSKRVTPTRIYYETSFLKPISGWLGFFIEFSFMSVENSVIQVTTEVNIVPEYYPFEDCTLESCYGTLV